MRLFLYNLITISLVPFFIFRLLLKSFKDNGYRTNLKNRVGIYKETSRNSIWFHAVSLGEVNASEKLISKYKKTNQIVLTVTTATGYRYAKKNFNDEVIVVYAPWDVKFFVENFIKQFKPKILILIETEIWPSMIYILNENSIPIVLANARLSESSLKKYLFLKSFSKDVFNKISLILAQNENSKIRFSKISDFPERIKNVGSIKFEYDKINLFKKEKISSDFILASSTHDGEDEIIIDNFLKLKSLHEHLKLMIVPRHPERANGIKNYLDKKNIRSKIMTEIPSKFLSYDCIVISQIGVLNNLYQQAKIAFVGGSLFKKYGGHNIIEPAVCECSFIVGPYMKNFEDILDEFKINDACIQINKNNQLLSAFKDLIENDKMRENMQIKARNVVLKNRGSLEKQYDLIKSFL